jgi:hypothetical protein
MKKILLIPVFILTVVFTTNQANAQVNDVGELLRSGVNDSNLLIENYIRPYANGFGANLNTGWNNSARPYKKFGFDLRFNAAFAIVPSSDQFFNIVELENQFEEIEVLNSSGFTPTIAGESNSRAVVGRTYTNPSTGQQEELFSFEMPDGTGFSYAPTPMIQATVGLIKDTDVSLRLVPTISTPDVDGEVSLFGFGAKHGLNQWIPGGAMLPVDLSVQFGYTKFTFDVQTDVNPESGSDIYNSYDASEWDGQEVSIESSGYTANLLVGKSLPILSVFAGIGFQSSTTDVGAIGSYPVTVPNENYNASTQPETKAIEAITDPINISIDGTNTVHGLAGFRLRFGFIAISGSYTLSDYPVANVGVGLSFR